jgi:hypothetical protein
MAIISDIQLSKNIYFTDQAKLSLTTSFAKAGFGFASFSITLFNDADGKYIEYSFDGTNVHGRVKGGEARKMDFCRHGEIWIRGENGSEAYRLEVY